MNDPTSGTVVLVIILMIAAVPVVRYIRMKRYFAEVLSNPVDEGSSGGLLGGLIVGVGFDEFAVFEGGAGADFRDEVRGSDLAPAVLG